MTSKEEILEILRYTNSIKNNVPLLKDQCIFLEELLSSANSFEDSSSKILIEKALSDNAELVYTTDKLIDIRLQYAITLLYKTSNYDECLTLLTELLLIPGIEEHNNYLQILLEMGSLHSILSKFEEAKFFFQNAQKLSPTNSEDTFRIVAKQANILYKQHKHKEAISVLEALLESVETISSHTIAGVCLTLGTLYSRLMNSEQSILYFQKAENLRDKNNFEFGVVLNNNLGNLYSRMHDLEQSVMFFEDSLQYAIKTEKIDLQIGSYVSLASIEIQRENFKVAQSLLENALQHIDEVPKSYITLRLKERLAHIYIHSGELELLTKAKTMIEETISDSINLQLEDLLSSSYLVYSEYFKSKGQLELQYENLIKSYNISLTTQNLFLQYYTSMELTEYCIQKKDKEAKSFLNQTERVFSQLHKGYQENNIALIYKLNTDVAILENRIEDAKMYYNKIVSLPNFESDNTLQDKIHHYKSYFQV